MARPRPRGRPAHPDLLTPAEWRVADGVRHGLSNRQIAERLGIGRDGVKFHVSNVLGKLGLADRNALRRWSGIAEGSMMQERNAMPDQSIGTIGQIARTVGDITAARHWYGEVLGLAHLFDAGTMAFFDCGGIRLMLSEGEAGPESILYFRVADLHGEWARVTGAGARALSAPHRIHTHDDGSEEWMAFVEDSDGRPLALMTRTAPKRP